MLFTLRSCYQRLSPDNRGSYWVIMTNVFVVIFTFWLGVFIQDLVASKSADASRKLAHYEIVDRMYPTYVHLYDSCGQVIGELQKVVFSDLSEEDKSSQLTAYIKAHKKEVLSFAEYTTEVVGKYKYYFDAQDYKAASEHNSIIMIGLKLMEVVANAGYTHYSSEQLENILKNYMCTPDFMLKGNPHKNIDSISRNLVEITERTKKQTSEKETIEVYIIQKMILIPAIENILLLTEEVQYGNQGNGKSWLWNISYMLLSVVIGIFVCNMFAKFIAPGNQGKLTRSNDEIIEMNKTIKKQEMEISRYKSFMYSKDHQIKELSTQNMRQSSEIQTLNKDISHLREVVNQWENDTSK